MIDRRLQDVDRRPCDAWCLATPADDAMSSAGNGRAVVRPGLWSGAIPVTIPNLITIGRLLLVPLVVWLIIAPHPVAAFWAFVAAGISDAVDGFIARQFNLRSDLGAYLDPVADKALLVSIYVTFATFGDIRAWVAILVVSRDLLIVGGVLLSWIIGQPMPMRPAAVSKVNTVAQLTLAAIVLADLAFNLGLAALRTGLEYVVGIFTIASAALYLVDWVRHMGGVSSAPLDRGHKDRPS
jgi:cardiolipin synthase